jgi:hypothetical protein
MSVFHPSVSRVLDVDGPLASWPGRGGGSEVLFGYGGIAGRALPSIAYPAAFLREASMTRVVLTALGANDRGWQSCVIPYGQDAHLSVSARAGPLGADAREAVRVRVRVR